MRAFEAALADHAAQRRVVASLPENMPEERAAGSDRRGIAPLCGIDEALAAAEAAAFIGEAWKRRAAGAASLAAGGGAARPASAASRSDEAEAKAMLARVRPGGAGRAARRAMPAEAVAAAEALGYPVALKALGVAHKSEAGAVRLNLRTPRRWRARPRHWPALGTGLWSSGW